LPLLREKELKASCEAIGIRDMRLWRMQDKTGQFEDPEKLADRIQEGILEVGASIVYTLYPGHAVHPEHNPNRAPPGPAASRLPSARRPLVYGTALSRERHDALGDPDLRLNVSDVIDKKMAALRAHRSQSESKTKALDEELKEHPERREELLAPYMTEE